MLSTSFEFRNRIAQNTKTLFKATLTLADGTVHNLTGGDIAMGSESFSDSVSSNGSFDIGAAIINQFTFELKNYEGQWDDADFTGATIVPYVGVQLEGGSVEWLLKGHYGVEQPEKYGSAITLTCLDNMRKFDRPYSDVTTAYPATAQTIVRNICTVCGVTLLSTTFANNGYVIAERPDDSGTLTCGAMLSYVAQVTGNYARCDRNGRLALSWYNTSAFEAEEWLDGDRFDEANPYASGDTADGGNFTDYSAGASKDGGGFGFGSFAILSAITGLTVATDDVVITGVRVTAQDGEDSEGATLDGETVLYGSEGYVLAISDNPLVLYGKASDVASQVGARVVGMRFRPFDVSALGNPAYEAGDPVIITDGKLRQYRSYITTLTYKVGHYEAFACNAETPGRHNAQSFSAMTEAIVQARNAIKQEKTAREQAILLLNQELDEAGGLYKTEDEQEDESIVYYLHDKPTLAESSIVWKLNAEAFGISTDGGRTYPFGFDAWGQAILNSIYTIGLDADYIDTGSIEVKDPTTHERIFLADIDTGVVQIGSYTASQLIDAVEASISNVDVEYRLSDSTSSLTGNYSWSTTAPAWVDGKYMWSRTATTSNGQTTYSTPTCISGATGASGTSVTVSSVQYAQGNSGTTAPSSGWQSSVPSVAQGKWLWVKTTYSDNTTATTCSYQGSDGADGVSVAIQSATKSNGTTTVVLACTDGTTQTLTIEDGADGTNGTAGANGYVHVAWANSADGSTGFSTSVSTDKKYIGVYTDNTAADSSNASDYSWSLIKGADGTSVTVSNVKWAKGTSGTSAPSSGWQTTVPTVEKGKWLWCRTTYSDGSTAETCAYQGTDGQDGNSVAVQSVSKSNGTTTVTLVDSAGTTSTLTIEDGADGTNGTAGANGYVHVAWATSSDGSTGFSTSVSSGKTYIGVYTDNTAADSNDYRDYSWSLIKGDTGTGVSAIVEQYCKSSSNTTAPADNASGWSNTQPAWESGKYIWTRSKITWTNNTTTYTTPVLAQAINNANEAAYTANSVLNDQAQLLAKLTGGYANDGLYLQNGHIYLNASAINAGSLTVTNGNNTVFSANLSSGTVTAGGFTIDSTSIHNAKMTLDSDGISLKNDTYNVGDIGTSQDVNDSTKKSLNFHLNGQGAMMTWAARTGTSGTYTRKLTYANKTFGDYTAGRLYVECPSDFKNNTVYHVYIDPNTGGADGGVTGTVNYVQSIQNPTFSLTNNSGIVFYKNGVFSTGSLGYSLTINHTTNSFTTKKGFVVS